MKYIVGVIGWCKVISGTHPPYQGSNFSSLTRKMGVKKAISEVVFSLLAFSRELECFQLLSVVLILEVNVFIFLRGKTLSMVEVYIGYNLNAQTHRIYSPAWSGLSLSYTF